jgi:hypothetical protein
MSQGNESTTRFVPSGVDAQSWLGFEHRIQERRFKALIETITTAVASRDGIAARAALEEARELRPDSAELQVLAARVALLPTGGANDGLSAYPWYRGLGAVAMLVVGIGLVIGIESFRSETSGTTPVKTVASATTPNVGLPQPASAPVVVGSPNQSASAATPDVMTVEARRPSTSGDVSRSINETKREEPVGTSGVSRAAAVVVPNRVTFRPAAAEPLEGNAPARREVSDDYVAPVARSEGRAGFTDAPAPSPALPANVNLATSLAANIAPQPISITAPPPPAPVLPATNTVATTTAAVAPRSDNSRVTQVLNQYARAYGQLDPGAAHAVWPTVDERALARAFASLESQDVSFDQCDIDIKGAVASASCRGTASYVGKIGSRQARTEPRQWNFELKLHGDDWKIEKAQTSAR